MEVITPMTSMDFDSSSPATIPFAWEDKPGVPNPFYKFLEQDFAFHVSGEFSSDSVPAEELIYGGVIKVLETKTGSSFSDLHTSRSRRTQSFSMHRGWEYPWEIEQQSTAAKNIKPQLVSSLSSLSASSSVKGSRKWRFRDLFLFRSASDGRAMDRDPLKKYSSVFRHGFGSGSKRRGKVSAHELHYNINRAVANDMKKKTFLPYKQGILGRSAFNPSLHALSNGFGVSHYNRE
ncbi:hypothetical protein SSX86_001927 [Deinandra increscens subsp. villosa]|uniref:Uncharacterized protein n=1 Tax=Deinandra increscens subsp. villosa TaxID=3103831 RepID=A0AAP0HD37_9ASTR